MPLAELGQTCLKKRLVQYIILNSVFLKEPNLCVVDNNSPSRLSAAEENVINCDIEEIRKLQRNHRIFGEIMNTLETGENSKGSPKGAPPLHEFKILDDGLLYRETLNNYGIARYQLVIPESYIDKALRLSHSLPIAGHGGETLTFERLRRFAYFPGMRKRVLAYCKSCLSCIKSKPSRDAPAPYRKFSDVRRPWQRIHMDLVGPLNVSQKGNRYVLTIIDALTRYLIVEPLPNKGALTVVEAINNQLICKFGVPSQIVTDQGTEFCNQILTELCKLIGIERSLITPYHPSSNGLIERSNGTIIKILRPLVEENPEIWDEMIRPATLAYNTAYHRSLKDSPHFILFHVDPYFPYESILKNHKPVYSGWSFRATPCVWTFFMYTRSPTLIFLTLARLACLSASSLCAWSKFSCTRLKTFSPIVANFCL